MADGSSARPRLAAPPRARLYGLGTALPPHRAAQPVIRRFMTELARASLNGEAARTTSFLERLYASSGIEARHSVLADYGAGEPGDFEFYPENWALEPFPTTERRMEVYELWSVDLAETAAREALSRAGVAPSEVTHLVLATCTGFFAPGPDILLLGRLGLPPDTRRSLLGFMGCYAGFNALRSAADIAAAEPEAVVLVVSVELCTLHFQKRPLPDFLVANSLFADGAAAAVLAAPGRLVGGLADLTATRSKVVADSLSQMSWRIGAHGFEMRLGRAVPASLGGNAPAFVESLLGAAGLGRGEVERWAVHPGGRAIVEAVGGSLDFAADEGRSAFEVLASCGNMSSATIFFVLARELERPGPGGPIAALGFGPGLSMEGAVLSPCR